jgi:hypothetical protein
MFLQNIILSPNCMLLQPRRPLFIVPAMRTSNPTYTTEANMNRGIYNSSEQAFLQQQKHKHASSYMNTIKCYRCNNLSRNDMNAVCVHSNLRTECTSISSGNRNFKAPSSSGLVPYFNSEGNSSSSRSKWF